MRVGQPKHFAAHCIVEIGGGAKAIKTLDENAERDPERQRDPALANQACGRIRWRGHRRRRRTAGAPGGELILRLRHRSRTAVRSIFPAPRARSAATPQARVDPTFAELTRAHWREPGSRAWAGSDAGPRGH